MSTQMMEKDSRAPAGPRVGLPRTSHQPPTNLPPGDPRQPPGERGRPPTEKMNTSGAYRLFVCVEHHA